MAYQRKTTSIKSLINQMKAQGVKVNYRHRSDGGYIITKINGQSFRGAQGNTMARAWGHTRLTGAQKQQRANAFERNPQQFTKDVRQLIKSTNEKMSYGHQNDATIFNSRTRVSVVSLSRRMKSQGKQAVIEHLKNLSNHAMGYAYPDDVDVLRARIIPLNTEGDFDQVIYYLDYNRENIYDDLVPQVYEVAYDVAEGRMAKSSGALEMQYILGI